MVRNNIRYNSETDVLEMFEYGMNDYLNSKNYDSRRN